MANASETGEIMIALAFALKPNQQIISRLTIEEEILRNPGIYPHIREKSITSLRRIITDSMDLVFTNQCEGKYRHKWVWDISYDISKIRGGS